MRPGTQARARRAIVAGEDAVLALAARPEAARRTAARRRAEQFDWQTCVDRMLALHAELGAVRAAA
jgi:alpha-1,6-mannosyltransferase